MDHRKRNTFFLILFIITAALGGFLAQRVFLRRAGSWALILRDGEEYARMPLDETAELLVGDEQLGYNRVRTEGGFVFVEEADCPDKICVREGKIRYAGESIACLPHKLIITVEADRQDGVDAVAG